MESNARSVTELLNAWGQGDEAARREVVTLVYQELRRLAAHYLQSERTDHTLQPTALVHELYLKLFTSDRVECRDHGHFLAVAARQLRQILVDYARSQHALKRGGAQQRISIDDAPELGVAPDERVTELDQALERLGALDPRAAQVVELRYFAGLKEGEIAEALDISLATVKRDWDFARTWLLKELRQKPA